MLDLKTLVSNPTAVEASLQKRRKANLVPTIHEVITLDLSRRQWLQEVEALKNRRNVASIEIGKQKKIKGDDSALLEEMKSVAREIKEIDERIAGVQGKINDLLLGLPNLLDSAVPEGAGAEDNIEIKKWGV